MFLTFTSYVCSCTQVDTYCLLVFYYFEVCELVQFFLHRMLQMQVENSKGLYLATAVALQVRSVGSCATMNHGSACDVSDCSSVECVFAYPFVMGVELSAFSHAITSSRTSLFAPLGALFLTAPWSRVWAAKATWRSRFSTTPPRLVRSLYI
jgi:hypothetical protein